MALSEFVYKRRVEYRETDASGMAHFTVFFAYAEEAEHAMWRAAGLSVEPHESEIGWPRVSASCEYHRALKFEQEFEIAVEIREISRRTITYGGTITRDGERVATATWKIACVAKLPDGTMRSTDIPGEIADRLKPSGDAPRTSPLAPPTL